MKIKNSHALPIIDYRYEHVHNHDTNMGLLAAVNYTLLF